MVACGRQLLSNTRAGFRFLSGRAGKYKFSPQTAQRNKNVTIAFSRPVSSCIDTRAITLDCVVRGEIRDEIQLKRTFFGYVLIEEGRRWMSSDNARAVAYSSNRLSTKMDHPPSPLIIVLFSPESECRGWRRTRRSLPLLSAAIFRARVDHNAGEEKKTWQANTTLTSHYENWLFYSVMSTLGNLILFNGQKPCQVHER